MDKFQGVSLFNNIPMIFPCNLYHSLFRSLLNGRNTAIFININEKWMNYNASYDVRELNTIVVHCCLSSLTKFLKSMFFRFHLNKNKRHWIMFPVKIRCYMKKEIVSTNHVLDGQWNSFRLSNVEFIRSPKWRALLSIAPISIDLLSTKN